MAANRLAYPKVVRVIDHGFDAKCPPGLVIYLDAVFFDSMPDAHADANFGQSAARVVLQNRPTDTIADEVAIQWDRQDLG